MEKLTEAESEKGTIFPAQGKTVFYYDDVIEILANHITAERERILTEWKKINYASYHKCECGRVHPYTFEKYFIKIIKGV